MFLQALYNSDGVAYAKSEAQRDQMFAAGYVDCPSKVAAAVEAAEKKKKDAAQAFAENTGKSAPKPPPSKPDAAFDMALKGELLGNTKEK